MVFTFPCFPVSISPLFQGTCVETFDCNSQKQALRLPPQYPMISANRGVSCTNCFLIFRESQGKKKNPKPTKPTTQLQQAAPLHSLLQTDTTTAEGPHCSTCKGLSANPRCSLPRPATFSPPRWVLVLMCHLWEQSPASKAPLNQYNLKSPSVSPLLVQTTSKPLFYR